MHEYVDMSFGAGLTHSGGINRAAGLNMSSSMYTAYVSTKKNLRNANGNPPSQNIAPLAGHNMFTSE